MMFNDLTKEKMLSEVMEKVAKYDQVVVSLGKKDPSTKQNLYIVKNSDNSDVYGATPSTIENLWFNQVGIQ